MALEKYQKKVHSTGKVLYALQHKMKKSLRLFFAHYYAEKKKKKLANISPSFFR